VEIGFPWSSFKKVKNHLFPRLGLKNSKNNQKWSKAILQFPSHVFFRFNFEWQICAKNWNFGSIFCERALIPSIFNFRPQGPTLWKFESPYLSINLNVQAI
jgi:hypothetical protein